MSSEAPAAPTVIIVSGLSGSGKSVALKTFEDLDYYCVDNLPVELLPSFVRSLMRDGGLPQKLAVGIDVRNRHSDLSKLAQWRAAVTELGLDATLLFFDATDEALLRRYSDTRRKHPLAHFGLSLPESITRERQITAPLRAEADVTIDTSTLNVHQLRRRIIAEFALNNSTSLSLLFESFAYKRGVPADADFVFDARVLPNPHWNPALRPFSGRDGVVRDYLDALLPDEWDAMSLYERRSFLSGSEFGAAGRVGRNRRRLVCNMEIWCECFGKEASAMKRTDSYEISSVMRKIEGWGKFAENTTGLYPFPIYGRQRAMQRISSEQNEQEE